MHCSFVKVVADLSLNQGISLKNPCTHNNVKVVVNSSFVHGISLAKFILVEQNQVFYALACVLAYTYVRTI